LWTDGDTQPRGEVANEVRVQTTGRVDDGGVDGGAGIGALHLRKADLGLEAIDHNAGLIVVSGLQPGEGAGTPDRIAEQRRPEWICNVDEIGAPAQMGADVETGPIVAFSGA
jgi:hypothetical protein